MSILKVNQIRTRLRQKFEPHLDLADLSLSDPDRENKVLSRCIAAVAVQLATACTDAEAAQSVWDGSDDNGIDAAYFDASESRVLLVQSKWINKGAGEPEAKEISTFAKGVSDLVEQDQTMFHPRLLARCSDMMLRLASPGTAVHLIVASTGSSTLAKHGADVIAKLLKDLNGEDPDQIASAATFGLSEIYDGLASEGARGLVTLDAMLSDWSFVAAPYRAYFGTVDGLQIKGWWKQHGKRVVSANIRHALGATDVNNQIKQTAVNVPEHFWYFNNGITVVAEEILKAPAGAASRSAGNFQFKNASIVNGAQTVSSLGSVDDEECLGRVRVALRIIDLNSAPPEFGREVTKTNNLQNRIEPRDFVAQDPEQSRLRKEMAMEGVDYQFVRSEDVASGAATACELLEVTTALACASGDPSLAVQAKTGLGRFFQDLTKSPYRSIFNPNTTGARAFNATIVLRAIEKWIDDKRKTVSKRSGPKWGVLIHGNRILAATAFRRFGDAKLMQAIGAFSTSFKPTDIAPLLEASYSKMVSAIETHYPGKFLAVLFKNPSMSKHVFEESI